MAAIVDLSVDEVGSAYFSDAVVGGFYSELHAQVLAQFEKGGLLLDQAGEFFNKLEAVECCFLPCTAYATKERCVQSLIHSMLQAKRLAKWSARTEVNLARYQHCMAAALERHPTLCGFQLKLVLGEVAAYHEGTQLLNRLEKLCRELAIERQMVRRKPKSCVGVLS